MNSISFVLCPDTACARWLRRHQAQRQPSLYWQCGTWTELLGLARDSFGLPELSTDWDATVIAAMRQLAQAAAKNPSGPPPVWSASFQVDEAAVGQLIAEQLRALLEATPPPTLQWPKLTPATRAESRVAELRQVHQQMASVLPDDLDTICRILMAPKGQAMRTIAVTLATPMPLSPWQEGLINHLNSVSSVPVPLAIFSPQGNPNTALGHLQRQLFASTPTQQKLDSSVQWLAVRDAVEEVEVVAVLIQEAMKNNQQLQPADFGILIPDDFTYPELLREVFTKAGLPLAGLPVALGVRDLAHELIHLYLQCRQPGVMPTMALAAWLSLPIMPWSETTGMRLAQGCFDDAAFLKQQVSILFPIPVNTASALLQELQDLVNSISPVIPTAGALPVAERLAELIKQLQPELQNNATPIPWSRLLKLTEPQARWQPVDPDYHQEGIAIFSAHEMAWREVQQLYVLGFVEGQYPRPAASSSFFLESEKAALAKKYRWRWSTTAELNRYAQQRLLQQLGQASQRIVFTLPLRNLAGEEQAPSVSLAYQAQLFSSIKAAHELVRNLDIATQRAQVVGLPSPSTSSTNGPRVLTIQNLNFGTNLLKVRVDASGQPKPESPSGLDKLLVSPLAWLLSRAHIEAKAWGIRELDAMTQGSLAHKVFEQLFVAQQPIPSQVTPLQVSKCLDDAIAALTPFLSTPEWHLEKTLLRQEIEAAAVVWREFLDHTGARILATEQPLTGVIFQGSSVQCSICGIADCIVQMPGNQWVIVDFKKSKASSRIPRMQKQYDLQASLYRQMLGSPGSPIKLTKGPLLSVYYMLNDQSVLADGAITGWQMAQVLNNIDVRARMLLKRRLEGLRQGLICLNRQQDGDRFKRITGIIPYALEDSPLILKFSHP